MPATATAPRKSNAAQTKSVPANAFMLGAHAFSLGTPAEGDTATTVPVTLQALSGKPVMHWYWDEVVLDLGGMSRHKDTLPIDYCHDEREVLGFLDSFTTDSGALVCAGALTPFGDADRASEVVAKSRAGVPYEASILWEPDTIEQVAPGVTAEVNGDQVQGPLYIIRKWSLRGVAICPHGVDRDTATQFSRSASEREVHIFSNPTPGSPGSPGKPTPSPSNGDPAMPDDQNTPNTKEQPTETSGETPTQAPSADDTQSTPADPPAESTSFSKDKGGDTSTPTPGSSETADAPAPPGAKFMSAFGEERGAVYFAKGMSFEDATTAHCKWQADRITALEANQNSTPKPGSKIPFSASPEGSKTGSPFRLAR